MLPGQLLLLLSAIKMLQGAEILGIFPMPSLSHQIVYHSLMKGLAARGHHITLLTTDRMLTDNPNVTQIVFQEAYDISNEFSCIKFKSDKRDAAELPTAILPTFSKIIDRTLGQREVKKLIENTEKRKFDVLIVEMVYFTPMALFAEIYDCPVIGISSFDASSTIYSMFGNEANPVIHPDYVLPYTHTQLSFIERWKSITFQWDFLFKYRSAVRTRAQILQHFPLNEFDLEKFIAKRLYLLLLNTHPMLDNVRPLLPNTIQLGFLHIEPPKPLPDGSLKTFMDNSKNGVIYMSFGSNVKSNELGENVLTTFLNVFRQLDYDVVWKFETDDLPDRPPNVMISKWFPQSDVLAHPAVKLFITQGGQQSIEEAIDRMVPMIVIPFLIDQYVNAKKMTEKGVGCQLELHSLNEMELMERISEMLSPIYRENVRNLKQLIYDQPMTSREKALWWIEFVIRNKAVNHFKYNGGLVPFYQKYCLDFIGIALVSAAVVFKVLLIVFRKLRYFSKRKFE